MQRAVAFSHQLLHGHLRSGDMCVDATAGNGHDTLLLTQLTAPGGMVFAFDVQERAIAATRARLQEANVPETSYRLIHAGHETMLEAIPREWHGRAGAVIFNLGYLPGSDKSLTTTAATTIPAMRAALELLRPGGILVAVIYTGHAAGKDEAAAVTGFAATLSPGAFRAVESRAPDAREDPPFVLALHRQG
jgi:predicted methyltransferase